MLSNIINYYLNRTGIKKAAFSKDAILCPRLYFILFFFKKQVIRIII